MFIIKVCALRCTSASKNYQRRRSAHYIVYISLVKIFIHLWRREALSGGFQIIVTLKTMKILLRVMFSRQARRTMYLWSISKNKLLVRRSRVWRTGISWERIKSRCNWWWSCCSISVAQETWCLIPTMKLWSPSIRVYRYLSIAILWLWGELVVF